MIDEFTNYQMSPKLITYLFLEICTLVPIAIFPATSSSTPSTMSEIATSASSSSSSSSSSAKSRLPRVQEKYFKNQPVLPYKPINFSDTEKCGIDISPTGDIVEQDEDKYADMEQEIKKNMSLLLTDKYDKIDYYYMDFLQVVTVSSMHQLSLLQFIGTAKCPCVYISEKPSSQMLQYMLNTMRQLAPPFLPLAPSSDDVLVSIHYNLIRKLQGNKAFTNYLKSLCRKQSVTDPTYYSGNNTIYYDLCFKTQCTVKKCSQLWAMIDISIMLNIFTSGTKYFQSPFPADPEVGGGGGPREASHKAITEIHSQYCKVPACDPGFLLSSYQQKCSNGIPITPKINRQLLDLTEKYIEERLDRYYASKDQQAFPKCPPYYLSSSSSSSSCSSGSSSSSSSERHLLTSLADKEHKYST